MLLEDSEDDAGLVSLALKRDGITFILQRVETKIDFIQSMDSFQPHVILSDHALPQFNSIEAFKLFKEKELTIPFILVTGTVSEEFAVNVIKQGVDDYILKSNLSRLPSAILSAMGKRNAEKERLEAQQRIAVQNKELLRINQELDSFVYSVSHNLRSPLLSVLGLINILNKEADLSSTALPLVQLMKKSVLQLDKTLKDIVEYSHNTHDVVLRVRIEWRKLIEDAFHQFDHLGQSNQIEKVVKISEDAPHFSDPQRISIILRNLFSNSFHYWDETKEKPTLEVNVVVSKQTAVLTVTDNGVGVSADSIPNVFNMFYRANTKSVGAGLGLYVVKEIVSKIKGSVELKSDLNKGTSVVVTFPNNADE